MLAGPDLLVVLGIALIVFGPQKLPEVAKSIGKIMNEFKKTTEEVKGSLVGDLKDLQGIKSDITDMDLLADLAEKVSTSLVPEDTGKFLSSPANDSENGKKGGDIEEPDHSDESK